MPPINKDHAKAIAKKLKATVEKSGGAHEMAYIYDDAGTLLASFGIRRSSNRNIGHGHIPADLHLSPHDTLELAYCRISREEWIRVATGDDGEEEAEKQGEPDDS